MAGLRDILAPRAGTRPRLACEVRPEGVVAARAATEKRGNAETVLAFAPLAEGALLPGLKVPNLLDAKAVATALGEAVVATNPRDKALTVVVPDAAARVLLLDFDVLPPRHQEALQVVRFRLRKMVPFEVETAAVSYQVMAQKTGQMAVLVTVMPNDVLAEYEGAVRDAGYEPGAVLPSTLAAAAALNSEGASLVVNQARTSVTTAITQGEEMLLHRTIDLPVDAAGREEEIAQAVFSTLAWYEDTLRLTPSRIYYAGPGGASAAVKSGWLPNIQPEPQVEDLAMPAQASNMTSIPAGVTAGVAGALSQ